MKADRKTPHKSHGEILNLNDRLIARSRIWFMCDCENSKKIVHRFFLQNVDVCNHCVLDGYFVFTRNSLRKPLRRSKVILLRAEEGYERKSNLKSGKWIQPKYVQSWNMSRVLSALIRLIQIYTKKKNFCALHTQPRLIHFNLTRRIITFRFSASKGKLGWILI